jgi:hypothetical protein
MALPPQSETSLGPSLSQDDDHLQGRAAVNKGGMLDPSQPFHQTPPRGVGVYGEFYGTGDRGVCELRCRHLHLQTRTE